MKSPGDFAGASASASVCRRGLFFASGCEVGPLLQNLAPSLQQVAARIGAFNLSADLWLSDISATRLTLWPSDISASSQSVAIVDQSRKDERSPCTVALGSTVLAAFNIGVGH